MSQAKNTGKARKNELRLRKSACAERKIWMEKQTEQRERKSERATTVIVVAAEGFQGSEIAADW